VAAGLSREELAARAGVKVPALISWEIGDAEPKLTPLLRTARALGLSVGELVEGRL
jgi:transcriptional regulator with XRE-family HTH domain